MSTLSKHYYTSSLKKHNHFHTKTKQNKHNKKQKHLQTAVKQAKSNNISPSNINV